MLTKCMHSVLKTACFYAIAEFMQADAHSAPSDVIILLIVCKSLIKQKKPTQILEKGKKSDHKCHSQPH